MNKKTRLTHAVYKKHLGMKDTHILKIKGWKKISHANVNEKKEKKLE